MIGGGLTITLTLTFFFFSPFIQILEEPGVNFNKSDSFAPTVVKPKHHNKQHSNTYNYDNDYRQKDDIEKVCFDNEKLYIFN